MARPPVALRRCAAEIFFRLKIAQSQCNARCRCVFAACRMLRRHETNHSLFIPFISIFYLSNINSGNNLLKYQFRLHGRCSPVVWYWRRGRQYSK